MENKLSVGAIRVLGCLIEKETSTPEYYPLTLNALKSACNQKSNRSPVVQFSETDVIRAFDELTHERIVGHATGRGSRVLKYRHALREAWELSPAECAALACLALRGPQTVGEVKGRTSRMYPFEDLDETQQTLVGLTEREDPLVILLARQPGQKESRYAHLLAGEADSEAVGQDFSVPTGTAADTTESTRSGSLYQAVEDLRADLDQLRKEFDAFRTQFE